MDEPDRPDEDLPDWYRRLIAEAYVDAVLDDIENWRPTGRPQGIPAVAAPTIGPPHLWNGTRWACLTCRQTSPDPCDCPCHAR